MALPVVAGNFRTAVLSLAAAEARLPLLISQVLVPVPVAVPVAVHVLAVPVLVLAVAASVVVDFRHLWAQ